MSCWGGSGLARLLSRRFELRPWAPKDEPGKPAQTCQAKSGQTTLAGRSQNDSDEQVPPRKQIGAISAGLPGGEGWQISERVAAAGPISAARRPGSAGSQGHRGVTWGPRAFRAASNETAISRGPRSMAPAIGRIFSPNSAEGPGEARNWTTARGAFRRSEVSGWRRPGRPTNSWSTTQPRRHRRCASELTEISSRQGH